MLAETEVDHEDSDDDKEDDDVAAENGAPGG